MSESENTSNTRRDFLQTVLAAPMLAVAAVDVAQAQTAPAPAPRATTPWERAGSDW